ncbi:NAD(P)-dependent oxidoreductase [Clostridium tagluense]|uniref:SDR family oxidoreductase n=1 Tax=Clostridium TaxID=1485 RepID=UPI0013E96EBC|nr:MULTISPECIES: NAD(P)-dependent oxidoreductase [Clostridium]MBU3127642.1 NAD(P)-dependent oxidoreductase [Clostridium tagluense]MBW9155151.1 NAD(P)-dependent oxidoreductase [Clostridium tagluense]MBZ9624778.1 NAD(P)-dependent oxidoreductase [Clostridium sp. FP2]MCB2311547.1 NAD(P)-dependent oxidoreductase [Clostridium tagluense]MCB2316271.1 NAD(P)-dependent oxidoreductase [Clostridium tagluense]
MNILITGAKGNIGTYLCSVLSKSHTIYGLDKTQLNIMDKITTEKTLNELKPDAVIHTAAITNKYICEYNEDLAYGVNTVGTLNIAACCNSLNIPILYLSSTDVYGDIKSAPYSESDECTPINAYSKSKLGAEELIQTICSKYFIIRSSNIFGGNDCFVTKLLKGKHTAIYLFSNPTLSITNIEDLTAVIQRLLTTDKYGVYNYTNEGCLSKSQLINSIIEFGNLNVPLILNSDKLLFNLIKEPKYTCVNSSLIKNSLDIEIPPWNDRLKDYINKQI